MCVEAMFKSSTVGSYYKTGTISLFEPAPMSESLKLLFFNSKCQLTQFLKIIQGSAVRVFFLELLKPIMQKSNSDRMR